MKTGKGKNEPRRTFPRQRIGPPGSPQDIRAEVMHRKTVARFKVQRKGLRRTRTENYGGPVVTSNGLLIIAATIRDNEIRIFDKKTGQQLWEAELPAAGTATPSVYRANGHEYIVIACGGGKWGAKSGGRYVAFALPH